MAEAGLIALEASGRFNDAVCGLVEEKQQEVNFFTRKIA